MYNIDYTLKPVSTFIETSDWIKNNKCIINSQNYKDNKCFQYYIIICLYHKEIKKNPERIAKLKPYINNLNWENINFPPQKQDYQQFEMNNKSIALNILQVQENVNSTQEKISHLYKSEHNKSRENEVILLMINDNEKQHYLAAKKLNALLKKHFLLLNAVFKDIHDNHFHHHYLNQFQNQ